jgi:hypothetical protein
VDRLNVARDERNRDAWGAAADTAVDVVWRIDVPRWKALLYRALGG